MSMPGDNDSYECWKWTGLLQKKPYTVQYFDYQKHPYKLCLLYHQWKSHWYVIVRFMGSITMELVHHFFLLSKFVLCWCTKLYFFHIYTYHCVSLGFNNVICLIFLWFRDLCLTSVVIHFICSSASSCWHMSVADFSASNSMRRIARISCYEHIFVYEWK